MLLDCEEVDVDAKDLKGDTTPLLLAIKEKHEASAKLLVENGASLNVKVGRSTLKEQFCKIFPDVDPAHIVVKKNRKVILDLKDKVFQLLKNTELNDSDYNAKLANFKTFMRFIRTLQEDIYISQIYCQYICNHRTKLNGKLAKKIIYPENGVKKKTILGQYMIYYISTMHRTE